MPKRDSVHMAAQRERILRAALQCIADKGVERSSITDIRKQAGLSAGAIYNHFQKKEDMVAEAVRFASVTEPMLPDDWEAYKTFIIRPEYQQGLNVETMVRARVHFQAEAMNPGRLHDVYRELFDETLARLTRHIQQMADKGVIKLIMNAEQTARSCWGFTDGILALALASRLPMESAAADLSKGLDRFVQLPSINGD